MEIQNYIDDLNNQYFDGKLSPNFQDQLRNIPIDRPDVLAMIERMFRLICAAGIPPTDLSEMFGEILGTLLGRLLPSAWEDRVPPVTVPGRHTTIDKYIQKNTWRTSEPKTMLDIGCGFPPYTTLDTAQYFPDLHIVGADPSLPKYLVHDDLGNYATFNKDKTIVYFQPSVPTMEHWDLLLKDAPATRNRFNKLLDELIENPQTNKNNFPRLEIDPIKVFESDNLSFITGGIGQIDIESKDVIRCFNVLFYFNNAFFRKALEWFGKQLAEGGILLIGGNWAVSTESFYYVYQKLDGALIKRALSFSIDCICPFSVATWYANHDDDEQAAELANYVSIIRSDEDFLKAYYAFHDQQRIKYGICPRDENGYYGNIQPSVPADEAWPSVGKILVELNEAGFNQRAVEVLRSAGINARLNEVGHISVLA